MSDTKTINTHHIDNLNQSVFNEKIFKQIALNANSIEIFRDEKGAIGFINNAASFVTGYTIDELQNQVSIQQLIHSDDLENANTVLKAIYSEQKPISDFCFKIITKDQSIKHLSLSAVPIYNDEDQFIGIHESIKDITESIELKEKISRLEELELQSEANLKKLKEAQKISKTASWEFDIIKQQFKWSDEIFNILEAEKTDFNNSLETFLSYSHPEDREIVTSAIQDVIINLKEQASIIHRVKTYDNKVKYLEARCQTKFDNDRNIQYLYGTITDITERITIENELNESKAITEKLAKELEESKTFYKDKLNLILTPESDIENIAITDLIDIKQLQKIQDSFVEATGVASIITDLEGVPITHASEFCRVCQAVRATDEGLKNCYNSDKIIGHKAIQLNQPYYEQCHSCGFVDAGAPIIIGDKPIAIWMIGQVSFGSPDKERLKSYAEKIGADQEAIDKEINKLKVTTPEKFEKIVRFLSILAQEISTLAHTNLVLAKKVEEQKKIYNELEVAKENSEESDKLKTAFLHNLSHEIRTPMNAIVGFSEMIKLPDITEESRYRYADFIIDNSKQLLSIVNDILIMSTLETNQEIVDESKVCLNQFLSEITDSFKSKYHNTNISLETSKSLPNEEACIFIDRSKLEHIISRILTNAYKYTDKGTIELSYALNDNKVTFSIKDSGIGIEAHKLDKIFERFSNAENTITTLYGGTGLGLAIAKGYVELLGGEIWVESEPDKGSTFYFTIPYNPAMKTVIKVNDTVENKSQVTKTILVAEDHEYNFIFLEEVLKHLNVNLIHARNGQEAINVVNMNDSIDLILMDIKMPIVDGHTAAIEIKKKYPKMPIIAQSAFALEHEKKRFAGKAFDDYITKPIDRSMLMEAIKKFIEV